MRAINLIAIFFVLLVASCSSIPSDSATDMPTSSANPNFAKVKVTQDGELFLNGEEVTLDELKEEFARLKAVNGEVWYYRENPSGEMPSIALQVLDAIIDAQLP